MATAPTGLGRIVRDLAPESSPTDSTVTLDGPALAAVAKIVELQLRHVPLDSLTADVLPAMLEIFDAPAGALLLYRREDATLTLATARGISVAGAEALDVLRWGDEQVSEMPLRALVDRKIYVVERPADDVFARRLVGSDPRRAVGTVAAVPLYRWQLPVGVLLLLGSETPLTADTLLAPSFAYSVLALALSNLLWAREERGATPLPASDVPPPPLICVPWIDRRREIQGETRRLGGEREAVIAAARLEGRAALEAEIHAARVESQQALEAGIATVRAESHAALEATITAAREESRSALDLLLQELRTAVSGMETERQATAEERRAFAERLTSFEQEHGRLAEQLASVESERGTLVSRLALLEGTLTRSVETAVAPEEVIGAPPPPRPAPPPVSKPNEPVEPPAAAPPPTATPVQALRQVLERDPMLRDHIHTALNTAIPAGRGNVTAVNFLDCDAARLAEMSAASDGGTVLVGYASHPERGSRILGPLRCFTAPPSAPEIAAAVDGANRGNRRTILLSEDIDAFMVAKTALTKSGHSVSMACDEKQALDLLAILRPDTVVVDVRGAGLPAVEFLDALGPESGRVLTLLIHGDPTGATLGRLAERMLRPPALDVNELVKVCRNALPETKRPGAPAAAKTTR